MKIHLNVNGQDQEAEVAADTSLLKHLRGEGYFGVKHGCETGECGACTVLVNGSTVNACVMSACQADGKSIETIEVFGERAGKGWRETMGLHPLQDAFVETGAIQCGYCTPAMILAAKELLDSTTDPSEVQVREAFSGVYCRCTGYLKPVQAVLRAAAVMRGESVPPVDLRPPVPGPPGWSSNEDAAAPEDPAFSSDRPAALRTDVRPKIVSTPQTMNWKRVGKPDPKVDAVKLALGKPAFTDDLEMRGMLYAKVLFAPVAHARILSIDVSEAKALEGVVSVLTWHDLPRVVYSTAGQSDPIPGPLDMFSLDNKVRYVGDRVAFVAAESEAIAEHALKLIRVEYEQLPAILDPAESLDNPVLLHDEPEYVNFDASDNHRNLASHIDIDIGNVDQGFAEADHIFEETYQVPKVQQVSIEPHAVITFWDEDDRMVIRTSTQVPFHVRRQLAPVLDLPIKRIRVIKPRIGGGFGGKQEVMIEDVAAHLTIATGRPVRYEYTREEEFVNARSRHPMTIRMRTGVKADGTMTANEMYCLTDTGAYGCHALTVTGNTGHKSMALYVGDGSYREQPNIRFKADIVYTNTPPAGAYRGYGVPQGFWAVERHMETIARVLDLDPIEFRLKNALREGELQPFSTAWSEGREPSPEMIETCGLEECVAQGRAAIGWDQKHANPEWRAAAAAGLQLGKSGASNGAQATIRRGVGVALVMQGTAIPYLDMGGASIKLNDDGSFNVLVGATDLGTGSDTVLAQIAAEVLGVPLDDILIYSSDTDFTPFDKGAYASSTTYISGAAVARAAQRVAEQISARAAQMLNKAAEGAEVQPAEIHLEDRKALAPDGRFVTLADVGHNSLHHEDQRQIMAVGSYVSPVAPPPFAAQFAEVRVDLGTGMVSVDKLVMAVDSGVIVNPITASGQVEGGMVQSLGYAVCEEMLYDELGQAREKDLRDYHIYQAHEMPDLGTIFVETFEPSHPFGLKAVAEIPMDGVAPAVANAILDACGAELTVAPATPERVWQAMPR
jgi:putative selenate reductase molybdopterin-binding subunit